MNHKLSSQGIATLMMVFNNAFVKMALGQNPDMTDVFADLEWYVNTDGQLVCDNPPILNLGDLGDLSEEE